MCGEWRLNGFAYIGQYSLKFSKAAAKVKKGVQQLGSMEKRLEKASDGVKTVYKSSKEYLGLNCKIITKESGDLVLMSQDALKKLRFNIIYPHRDAPRVYLEVFKNSKWRNALKGTHRVYPQK